MDTSTLFPDLPDAARCWVHTAATPMTEATAETLEGRMEDFIEGWASHGRSVTGRVAVLENRFLVLAATLPNGSISGCGIDGAVHAIEEAAADLQIDWMPALHVAYRGRDGSVETVSRPTFRSRVEEGEITAETPVFDPSVTELGEVRSGSFEQPAGASWHARTFSIPQTA
jgi:hypothetical protein